MNTSLFLRQLLPTTKRTFVFNGSRGINTRSSTTRIKQDKHKRSIVRRVIRPKNKKPEKSWLSNKLPEIMTPQSMAPKQTKPLPDIKPIMASNKSKKDKAKQFGEDLFKWIKQNAGIIILNAGSLCTLTAFTRSDILELRCLSVTGSLSSVVYFLSLPAPKVWFPAIWSSIFAMTNAYKVYFILEERKGKPKFLTTEEMKVYDELFMPHGVTPRQWEKLLHISKEIRLEKGQVLVENGKDLETLYIVKSGCISAVTGMMKRRVTAASTDKSSLKQNEAGNSGAWIGELAFLDVLAAKDVKIPQKTIPTTIPMQTQEVTQASAKEKDFTNKSQPVVASNPPMDPHSKAQSQARAGTKKAILTYVATEETIVYAFDHKEMCELLSSSADMRAAITRAMTAAVVQKVVNMYLSKVDAEKPMWQKWLEDNWNSGVKDMDKDSGVCAVAPIAATEVKKHS